MKVYFEKSILFCLIFIFTNILLSCTSQEDKMREYKQQALDVAWEQERELINLGHSGTREWTLKEQFELIETAKVKGYEGRYINYKVDDNPHLAINPDNIVFIQIGDLNFERREKEKQNAALRSYILKYQKNKYALWGGVILSLTVLIVAFKKQRGIIIYPAIVGAVLGALRLGIISQWSIMATLGGLASGFIMGTLAGLFIFLVIVSVGVG
ncbi:MAG: hypothetical protein KAH84_05950 [Thiomargarita sp.]|nr:hypothetical protein [Thiomargarita sp.]